MGVPPGIAAVGGCWSAALAFPWIAGIRGPRAAPDGRCALIVDVGVLGSHQQRHIFVRPPEADRSTGERVLIVIAVAEITVVLGLLARDAHGERVAEGNVERAVRAQTAVIAALDFDVAAELAERGRRVIKLIAPPEALRP